MNRLISPRFLGLALSGLMLAPVAWGLASVQVSVLALQPNPAWVGQTLTVKTQVQATAPNPATPSGSIDITVAGQTCRVTLPNSQCSVPLLAPGSFSVTASYSGDASFSPATLTQPGTATVQADPNDSDGDGLPNALESAYGLNPTRKDNNLFAATTLGQRLFVQQQFRDLLFREASANASAYWEGQMAQGLAHTPLVLAFLNSNPANTQVKPLARLFIALFGHLYANDSINGFVFYGRELAANRMTLDDASAKLVASAAFHSQYGTLTDRQFAQVVLRQVLGATPSSAQLDAASTAIAASSRAAWLRQQAETPAFVTARAAQLEVEWLFLSMGRKVPSASAQQYWLNQYASNTTQARTNLIQAFLGVLNSQYGAAATAYAERFMPPVFSVGGQVTGLTTNGLVLANAGSTVSPTPGMPQFVFPQRWVEGTAYAVTVQTQPPGQTCSVSQGSGLIPKTHVANVQVSCTANAGKLYWVSPNGNNQHGCLNASTDACASIQKALSLAQAGDTVLVAAGTYIEDSSTSPYTPRCGFFSPSVASLCVNASGTANAPITLRAAPGAEGQVILDSQGQRVGLQMNAHDYITIQGLTFKNNYIIGVANYGQAENAVADVERLSIGCLIENNRFYNTLGPWGENISAIGMWSTKDWVVRNNLIDGVASEGGLQAASGIQSYGVINALIEHNTIKNAGFGVFWKDHFVQDLATRTLWNESEIRYNNISAYANGIAISIRGTDSPEAGHNYIHHNIISGLGSEGQGIHAAMNGAFAISGDLRIEHNLIDGGNAPFSLGISVDSQKTITLKGNMVLRTTPLDLIEGGPVKLPHLTASDYNIFDENFHIIADRYASPRHDIDFWSLSSWQQALDTSVVTLSFDHPDLHSQISSVSALFVDPNNGNYHYTPNAIARGMMPDLSHAGPYQTGLEQIGSSLQP